jgi:predicted small secreted protein
MKISSVVIALIAVFHLSGCNTVGGMGKDIQKGGQAIEKSTK